MIAIRGTQIEIFRSINFRPLVGPSFRKTLEIAIYIQTNDWVDFAAADPREVVGKSLSSTLGFKAVHEALLEGGLLKQVPSRGVGAQTDVAIKKHLCVEGTFFI